MTEPGVRKHRFPFTNYKLGVLPRDLTYVNACNYSHDFKPGQNCVHTASLLIAAFHGRRAHHVNGHSWGLHNCCALHYAALPNSFQTLAPWTNLITTLQLIIISVCPLMLYGQYILRAYEVEVEVHLISDIALIPQGVIWISTQGATNWAQGSPRTRFR